MLRAICVIVVIFFLLLIDISINQIYFLKITINIKMYSITVVYTTLNFVLLFSNRNNNTSFLVPRLFVY